MARFTRDLGFYSGTVPSFEQYTLARFLSRGYFEKHINRMRKAYRLLRNRVIGVLERCPYADRLTIREQDAGLHFLLKAAVGLPDGALKARCRQAGIRVDMLSDYYVTPVPEEDRQCLVVNYAGLTAQALDALERILSDPGKI